MRSLVQVRKRAATGAVLADAHDLCEIVLVNAFVQEKEPPVRNAIGEYRECGHCIVAPSVSFGIVLLAVHFDGEHCFATKEVKSEVADRMFSPELKACAIVAEQLPHQIFCC